MRILCLSVTVLAVWTSAAAAQVQPVLTLSFDKDLNGVGSRGTTIRGTPVGKPILVDGKFGKALKSGSTTGFVDYPTEGILNPRGGTIEMWVCPLDWLPEDGKFHTFFDVRGKGHLYLYKYWMGTDLLMLTCSNLQGPYGSSGADARAWKPGQWHHVAGTWSPRGVMVYVDGKPAGKDPVEGSLPTAFGPTFRIGDQPWQFPRSTSSLIDEVRIYDRPLTPAHLAAHFAGNYRFSLPLSKDTVRIVYASAYKRLDGRTLLVIGNLSKEPGRRVRINGQRLGTPLAKIVSWPDKQPQSPTGGRLHLKVPRLGYRMLVVGSP